MAERQMPKTEEYPDNSHKARAEKKKVVRGEKIVKGTITKKKKPIRQRIAEQTDLGEKDSIVQYIIYDVLIPSAKSTISDIITGGIEMLLYGEGSYDSTRSTRGRNRSYTSYNSCYGSKRQNDSYSHMNHKAAHSFDDIIFDNRQEAEDVLSHMIDILNEYQQILVADLYDLVGETSTFTDYKWGWENLSSASVARTRDGYILKLPRTVPID